MRYREREREKKIIIRKCCNQKGKILYKNEKKRGTKKSSLFQKLKTYIFPVERIATFRNHIARIYIEARNEKRRKKNRREKRERERECGGDQQRRLTTSRALSIYLIP